MKAYRKHPDRLSTIYRRGHSFQRVTVIRGYLGFAPKAQGEKWLVVGPGVNWLGQPFSTFDQAITFATFHALKIEAARRERAEARKWIPTL